MKPKQLLKKLHKLGYDVDPSSKTGGSHVWITNGERRFLWAFHEGHEIPARLVKKILTKDAGLSEEEARKLLS